MKDAKIIKILKKVKAIYDNDHFVLTSGKHTPLYINKDTLYLHTFETAKVGKMMAEKFKNKNIEVVVAPAVGGAILSQWTAYYLSKITKKEVLSAYTEKDKGTLASAVESMQILRRGYNKVVRNKRVLVVEDLTSTGISVKKVAKAVKEAGGHVVSICVMVNRDPINVTAKSLGLPFTSLGELIIKQYNPDNCDLCKNNVPMNIILGHGKKFLAEKGKLK